MFTWTENRTGLYIFTSVSTLKKRTYMVFSVNIFNLPLIGMSFMIPKSVYVFAAVGEVGTFFASYLAEMFFTSI